MGKIGPGPITENIHKKSEILIPAIICPKMIYAITKVNIKPIFYDLDSEFKITLKCIEKKISNITKAVVIPHFYGLYNDDIKKLKSLIKSNKGKIKRCYLILAVLPPHNRQYSHGLENRNITGPSTGEIEDVIQKTNYTSKIMPIILNTMYDKRSRIDVRFQKKHGLLRRYRK